MLYAYNAFLTYESQALRTMLCSLRSFHIKLIYQVITWENGTIGKEQGRFNYISETQQLFMILDVPRPLRM